MYIWLVLNKYNGNKKAKYIMFYDNNNINNKIRIGSDQNIILETCVHVLQS